MSRAASRQLGINGFLAGENFRDGFIVNQLGGINPINIGAGGSSLVTENLPFFTDVNGINNVAGESYHLLYSQYYGIRATSLRLTNTYGPRHQMRHSRQGFLNWFVRLAMDDDEIQIYGEGSQLRDFTYVDDVVEALLLAGVADATDGEVYNLGSGEPVSVRRVAEIILEVAGRGSLRTIPFPEDKKRIEVGDYYADFSKIQKMLGWRPTVSLPEGVAKTIAYYLKCKDRYW